MRNNRGSRLSVRKVVSLVGVVVFGSATIVFGVLFAKSLLEVKQAETAYTELRAIMQQEAYEYSISEDALAGVSAGATDAGDNQVKEPTMDFTTLQELNADVALWLIQEGSVIDYPVVKGIDNEYYLKHLIDGQSNRMGTLFLDYRNSADLSDKCSIIYGHNMKSGVMFGSLTEYMDQDYYDQLPIMTVYTPERDYTLELFAGITVSGDYQFIRFDFQDDADFLSYVDSLKAESTFMTGVEVLPEDRIVALCTCSYEFDNARYALFGRLVEK